MNVSFNSPYGSPGYVVKNPTATKPFAKPETDAPTNAAPAPQNPVMYYMKEAIERKEAGDGEWPKFASQALKIMDYIADNSSAKPGMVETGGFEETKAILVTWSSGELLLLHDDKKVNKQKEQEAQKRWLRDYIGNILQCPAKSDFDIKNRRARFWFRYRAKSQNELRLKLMDYPRLPQERTLQGIDRRYQRKELQINITEIDNHSNTEPQNATYPTRPKLLRKVMLIFVDKEIDQNIIRRDFETARIPALKVYVSATSKYEFTNTWFIEFYQPVSRYAVHQVQRFKTNTYFPHSRTFTTEELRAVKNFKKKYKQALLNC